MVLLVLVGVVAGLSAVLVAGMSSPSPARKARSVPSPEVHRCVCGYFTTRLATTSVRAYNASSYSDAALTTLVQYADRGMDTQDPVDFNVAALIGPFLGGQQSRTLGHKKMPLGDAEDPANGCQIVTVDPGVGPCRLVPLH